MKNEDNALVDPRGHAMGRLAGWWALSAVAAIACPATHISAQPQSPWLRPTSWTTSGNAQVYCPSKTIPIPDGTVLPRPPVGCGSSTGPKSTVGFQLFKGATIDSAAASLVSGAYGISPLDTVLTYARRSGSAATHVTIIVTASAQAGVLGTGSTAGYYTAVDIGNDGSKEFTLGAASNNKLSATQAFRIPIGSGGLAVKTTTWTYASVQFGSRLHFAAASGSLDIQVREHFPGSATSYGVGCIGSNGTPVHDYQGIPETGQTTTYTLASGPIFSTACLLVGYSNSAWSGVTLPMHLGAVGAPGCMLYTSADQEFCVPTTGKGTASVPIPFPPSSQLIGARLFTQFVSIDPTANQLGVTMSNALASVIGGTK